MTTAKSDECGSRADQRRMNMDDIVLDKDWTPTMATEDMYEANTRYK